MTNQFGFSLARSNMVPLKYMFTVTNIKISVKIPQLVELDFVEERCKKLSQDRIIFCSRKRANILTVRYNNFTYILFKGSSKPYPDGSIAPQHCNITKLKSQEDIVKAIPLLFFLVDQPPAFMNYTIDNYSCCADIFDSVDIESFFIKENNISCNYSEENFPALSIYSPLGKDNLCCYLYRSGKFVFVGGKNLSDTKEFFLWIVEKIQPYLKK